MVKRRPDSQTTRPPEPIRPLPATRAGTSLLSAKARRRRYSGSLPPKAGSSGW